MVEDVVAQLLQGGLGVRGGELGRVFDLLPHRHVDLLHTHTRKKEGKKEVKRKKRLTVAVSNTFGQTAHIVKT